MDKEKKEKKPEVISYMIKNVLCEVMIKSCICVVFLCIVMSMLVQGASKIEKVMSILPNVAGTHST